MNNKNFVSFKELVECCFEELEGNNSDYYNGFRDGLSQALFMLGIKDGKENE